MEMTINIKEPTPREDDTRGEFMQRCVIDPETKATFPDNVPQRIAFCAAQWSRAKESLSHMNVMDILLEATSNTFDSSPRAQAGLLATERFTNALMVYFENLYSKFPFAAFDRAYGMTLAGGVKESRNNFSLMGDGYTILHEAIEIGVELSVVVSTWVDSEFQLLNEIMIDGTAQGHGQGERGGLNDMADDAGLDSPFAGNTGFIGNVSDAALNYARDVSGQLVTGVSDSTKNQIGRIIEDGLLRQTKQETIADRITALISDDARALKRAAVIASTETNRAMSLGARTAADEVGATEKEWVTVGDRRVNPDICLPNEGQGRVSINSSFGSGHDETPGHPSCRCVVTYFGADPAAIQNALARAAFG